jgi:hypothetical protein
LVERPKQAYLKAVVLNLSNHFVHAQLHLVALTLSQGFPPSPWPSCMAMQYHCHRHCLALGASRRPTPSHLHIWASFHHQAPIINKLNVVTIIVRGQGQQQVRHLGACQALHHPWLGHYRMQWWHQALGAGCCKGPAGGTIKHGNSTCNTSFRIEGFEFSYTSLCVRQHTVEAMLL